MLGFDKESQKKIFEVAEARENGDPISEENTRIAFLMDMHPEFDELWPNGEFACQAQPVNGQIVNPFVHMVLHSMVDNQILNQSPFYVYESYQRLKSGGLEEHELLHVIMSIFGDIHFRHVRQGGEFGHGEYQQRLEKTVLEEPTDNP